MLSFSLFRSVSSCPQVPFVLQGFISLSLVCYLGGFSVDNFVLVQDCLSACLLFMTQQLWKRRNAIIKRRPCFLFFSSDDKLNFAIVH